jgi:LysR family transcriptional regulator, glycine cleavage system transcriptional activator
VSPLRLLSPSPIPVPSPMASSIGEDPARFPSRARVPRVQLLGPGVDLESLRCFEAVATTLRFRAAAARVHLSPGALSDRIRRLEEGLGTRILERTTRSVSLTLAGERLLPLARSVLGLVDSMPEAARADELPQHYALVIGTRYEIGLSWLCPILGGLGRKCPERTVHLYNGSSSDLLGRLETGELDAVVASLPINSPRLVYAALHEEEYLLVGTDATLRYREDARQLTLVDIGPDLPLIRYFLDAQSDAEPWPFARVEYMGGIANVRLRLLEGEGRVGVLPTFFIRSDLAKSSFKKLMPQVRLRSDSLRLIWRRGHPREPELTALAHDLREFPLR